MHGVCTVCVPHLHAAFSAVVTGLCTATDPAKKPKAILLSPRNADKVSVVRGVLGTWWNSRARTWHIEAPSRLHWVARVARVATTAGHGRSSARVCGHVLYVPWRGPGVELSARAAVATDWA